MFKYDESFYVEKEVAVSAEKTWDIIALPGGLTLYHPYMKKHTAESWNGVGSKDHVTYYSGLEYDREVVKWIDGTGYDLKVTENGKHEITVIFRITPIDDQRCILRVTIHADFMQCHGVNLAVYRFKPVSCNNFKATGQAGFLQGIFS
jgi:hypothetical protein